MNFRAFNNYLNAILNAIDAQDHHHEQNAEQTFENNGRWAINRLEKIFKDKHQNLRRWLNMKPGVFISDRTGQRIEIEIGRARKAIYIATWPVYFFERILGKCGVQIWRFANGLDNSPVECRDYEMLDKSCGHGITTLQDLISPVEVWNIMLELCQDIGHRLRQGNKKATGVAIMIRNSDLFTKQWQCGISQPTYSPTVIAKESFALFQRSYSWGRYLRLS